MTQPTAQPTDNNQYMGTSNPPPDSTITVPNDNDESTVQQTAAPNTPPSPSSTNVTPQATPVQTTQATQQQQGQNNQQPVGKQVDLSKNPKGPIQPNGAALPPAKPPIVQKAGVFHDVAEALAGGPRYTYDVDAYGNTQTHKVPVSNAHLALAIAMEALGGAATGLAQKGSNATGQAAAAGLQQGEKAGQQVQQANQQQRQQASEDFARKAQITETNMRMYASARALGKQDADNIDSYIGQYKDLANRLQTEYPGYIKATAVKYSDLPKYNATVDTAIPVSRVPRIDPNTGKQIETNGVPQWDIDYMVLNPSFKASGLISPDQEKTLKEWGEPGFDNPNVQDTPFSASLALNKASRAAHLSVAESTLNNYWDTLDKAQGSGASTNSFDADTLNDLVTKYAKENSVDPKIIKAVIDQESQGDPNAVSPTGATGLMQLTGTIAKQFNVNDRANPEQNIQGGTQLFAQLLNRFKDPRLAYAAYYSGPGAIQNGKIVDTKEHTAADTAKQADHFAGILANGAKFDKIPTGQTTDETTFQHPTIAQWVKDNPTAASDMEKFMGALNGTDGKYSAALQHLISSGPEGSSAAGRVVGLLGGPDAVTAHDNYIQTQAQERAANVQINKAEQIAENKEQLDERNSSITQSYLIPPDNFQFDPNFQNLDAQTLKQTLAAQGVKVPTNFEALYDVAHYKAPASILPARTWQKGAPNEMDTQTGLSYLNQFINPGYNQTKYQPAQKVRLENVSGNSKNGASIQNAGVAAQHLNLLKQAGDALDSGNIQALNNIANQFHVQIGASPIATYNALVPIVAQEVGKVAAGGTVPYKEAIEADQNALTAKASPQQRAGVIKGWTNLMYGRINAIDENTYDITQEHLENVPKEATALFQQYGNETPWQQKQQQQNQSTNKPLLPGQKQGEIPVYRGNQVIGFSIPGAKGYRPLQQQQ